MIKQLAIVGMTLSLGSPAVAQSATTTPAQASHGGAPSQLGNQAMGGSGEPATTPIGDGPAKSSHGRSAVPAGHCHTTIENNVSTKHCS